jgi:hypothetical protein
MKSKSKLLMIARVARVAVVLTAVGYASWRYWEQQNAEGAAIWAAGTDSVD